MTLQELLQPIRERLDKAQREWWISAIPISASTRDGGWTKYQCYDNEMSRPETTICVVKKDLAMPTDLKRLILALECAEKSLEKFPCEYPNSIHQVNGKCGVCDQCQTADKALVKLKLILSGEGK